MNKEYLKLLQSYPLDVKVMKSQLRIMEWVERYGCEGVYVSLSGGKDSTVLLHLVRQLYPSIPAVFCDTGLEYPEIREFVKTIDNVTWLKPKMSFRKVINEKGYPVVSKAISNTVRLARQNIKDNKNTLRVRRIKGLEKGSKFNYGKWEFLLDAPFKISDECCNELKKKPFKEYEKNTLRVPFIGTMACESLQRESVYLKTGCNAFESKRPLSTPLGFWTEQDILEYIYKNDIKIADIYGDVIFNNDKYELTGVKRTGCMFCMFGCHLEKSPNRFEKMKVTHPSQYDYCINKLNLKEVLDYINVKY